VQLLVELLDTEEENSDEPMENEVRNRPVPSKTVAFFTFFLFPFFFLDKPVKQKSSVTDTIRRTWGADIFLGLFDWSCTLALSGSERFSMVSEYLYSSIIFILSEEAKYLVNKCK